MVSSRPRRKRLIWHDEWPQSHPSIKQCRYPRAQPSGSSPKTTRNLQSAFDFPYLHYQIDVTLDHEKILTNFPDYFWSFFVLNNQIPKLLVLAKGCYSLAGFSTVVFLWWWIQLLSVLLVLQFHYYFHLYWFYFDYLSSFSIIFPFRFRIMCHFICNHSLFGNVVLVCIMVSSFMLAAEDPLNSASEHNKVSNISLLTHWANTT